MPIAAAFGVVGIETMLPVSLRLVHEGHMPLLALLRRMTVAPADLILFDPDELWKVTEQGLSSLAKNTAFEGRLVQGRVHRTLVDGRTVYRRGER